MKKIRCLLTLLVFCLVAQAYAAPLPAVSRTTKLEFVGSVLLESNTDKPVLGISSIRYDEEQDKFIVVSDDTGVIQNGYGQYGKARYYEVSASTVVSSLESAIDAQSDTTLDSRNILEVTLKIATDPSSSFDYLWQWFNSWTWINDGHVDTEGMALINQDEMLISSEQGATYPFDRNRMHSRWDIYNGFAFPEPTVYSTFLHIDRNTGTLLRRHYLPSYYHSPIAGASKGMQRNKGVESVDRIPGTGDYIAITEAALQQDIAPWKKARPRYAKRAPSRLLHFASG